MHKHMQSDSQSKWVKCCPVPASRPRARTKNAPGFADRGHLAWDRPRERRVAVHVHPLQLRQLARWLLPQMAGGMGTVAALPTPSSRITQCTPKGGLAKGHGSVRALAPGVLRYRVRDATAVPPIGEVHSVRRGRRIEPVSGRV
eukprot:COSAG03_NODE_10825_length_626_cov_1.662239_1_plen_143_part_10